MDTLNIPDNVWLAGLILVAASGVWFAFDRLNKRILSRLRLRGRKSSTAGTPPPSIPDEKKTTGPPSPAKYTNALPPQRRHALANVESSNVPFTEVDENHVSERTLPMDMDYRACTEERYTPTGFSVEEIKALGDFPNYAELSGVPLPQEYREFNIDKALPRPYRPFRWSYHQTMCTSPPVNRWLDIDCEQHSRNWRRIGGLNLKTHTRPGSPSARSCALNTDSRCSIISRDLNWLARNSWRWFCSLSARDIRSISP